LGLKCKRSIIGFDTDREIAAADLQKKEQKMKINGLSNHWE
jgi:hypothetical protein